MQVLCGEASILSTLGPLIDKSVKLFNVFFSASYVCFLWVMKQNPRLQEALVLLIVIIVSNNAIFWHHLKVYFQYFVLCFYTFLPMQGFIQAVLLISVLKEVLSFQMLYLMKNNHKIILQLRSASDFSSIWVSKKMSVHAV